MIREALYEDIPKLHEMARRFFDYAGFENKGLNLCYDSVSKLAGMLIGNENGVLLVDEDENHISGTIGGIIAPWMCDMSQFVLTETWWWVNPESRGIGMSLIKAFIAAGKKLGASFCIMVTLDVPREEQLKDLYLRMGFSHLEHHFLKRL